MAIGDNIAQMMGTAQTNRQPTSGVEEQIASIVKPSIIDPIEQYDGSVERDIMFDTVQTKQDNQNAQQRHNNDYNISIMITNSVYIRKQGTTDLIYIGGVQTNV